MSPFAVMPVLVGPLQVLVALLPALLMALGGGLFALFKPSGLRKLVRFFWHQKLFSAGLLLVAFVFWQGYPRKLWSAARTSLGFRADGSAEDLTDAARRGEWSMERGGPHRRGWAGGDEPTAAASVWTWNDHKTVYSSPTVAGDRVYFTTVHSIGPFTPTGKGAVVCVDAATGREHWRYEGDDGDLRGTFSSPAVAEERVVVGEGLHQTSDARVTCLDLSGKKIWDYRTHSHVESTPCIHNGRVYVAAAGDGFYCFDLKPKADGQANVLWHLEGKDYPDCESSAVTDGETVWFGLGEEGNALVAVSAADGKQKWRVKTPYPVFGPPTLVQPAGWQPGDDTSAEARIYVGMGNGNFVFSADELRAAKVEQLKEEGKSAEEIAAAEKALATGGAVWSVNAATGDVIWKRDLPDTVLGAVAFVPAKEGDAMGDTGGAERPGRLVLDRLVFGNRDGHLRVLSTSGEPLGQWHAGAPILSSPAVAGKHAYAATKTGHLFALRLDTLQPAWETTAQQSGNLTSSPALGHGHVYLGTEDQGLRCLGTTELPPTPVWDKGELGGMADDIPLPDKAEIGWTLKTTESASRKPDETTYGIPAPMGDSLYVMEYNRYDDTTTSYLLRLRMDDASKDAPAVVWRKRTNMSRIVGCAGNRIVLAGAFFGQFDVVDAQSGSVIRCHHIRNDYKPEPSRKGRPSLDKGAGFDADGRIGGVAVSTDHVWFWSGRVGLTCLSLRSGDPVWNIEGFLGDDFAGRPIIVDDILYGSAGTKIVAVDAPTGALLWKTRVEPKAVRSPTVCGRTVAVHLADNSVQGIDVRDGTLLWRHAADRRYPIRRIDCWKASEDRLVLSSANRTAILRAADGEPLYELLGKERQIGEHGITGIQNPADLLISTQAGLMWWRPENDEMRSFVELSPTDLGYSDTDNLPVVAARRRAYVALLGKGLVCLRGVAP